MRQMNDDILLRIAISWAIFMSIWITTMINPTQYKKQFNNAYGLCTGIFSIDEKDLVWEDLVTSTVDAYKTVLGPPQFVMLVWISITLILMVAVKIGHQKISLEQPSGLISPPKDLESILLNFTLIVLLTINMLGFSLYWKK